MNFSKYFLLIATGILVVSVQNSDAGFYDAIKGAAGALKDSIVHGYENVKEAIVDATSTKSKQARDAIRMIQHDSKRNQEANTTFVDAAHFLRKGYTNCTKLVAISENSAMDGLSAAEKLIRDQPKAAREALHQEFQVANNLVFLAGSIALQTVGVALAASNDGARQGMLDAVESFEKAGFGPINGMAFAEKLVNKGSENGGNAANQSIRAARLSLQTGYAGFFSQIQKVFKQAFGGLRDAQNRPMNVTIENLNADFAARDAEASAAIKEINEAAENAIKLGANAVLVNKVRKVIVSVLGDLAKVAAGARQDLENTQSVARGITAAANRGVNNSKTTKDGIKDAVANVYLVFGWAGFEAGCPWSSEIRRAIGAVEHGKTEVTLGNEIAEEVRKTGKKYDHSDAPHLGYQAALESGRYGKIALFQRIVEATKIVFNFLLNRICT